MPHVLTCGRRPCQAVVQTVYGGSSAGPLRTPCTAAYGSGQRLQTPWPPCRLAPLDQCTPAHAITVMSGLYRTLDAHVKAQACALGALQQSRCPGQGRSYPDLGVACSGHASTPTCVFSRLSSRRSSRLWLGGAAAGAAAAACISTGWRLAAKQAPRASRCAGVSHSLLPPHGCTADRAAGCWLLTNAAHSTCCLLQACTYTK